MSKPKPAPLPSGTVVGGYQVIKKLAAGGFGVVYLCEDGDRKLVALKEYLPSSLAERSPGSDSVFAGRNTEGQDRHGDLSVEHATIKLQHVQGIV